MRVTSKRIKKGETDNKIMWCVYLLQCCVTGRTYKGCTNNMERRLRQHNGELSGGAKYTSRYGPWRVVMVLGPIACKRKALSIEWHWKHPRGPRSFLRGALEIHMARGWMLWADHVNSRKDDDGICHASGGEARASGAWYQAGRLDSSPSVSRPDHEESRGDAGDAVGCISCEDMDTSERDKDSRN